MNKNEKTEYLLSMVGEIDDILLEEAVSYKKKRKKTFLVPLVAACVAVCMTVMLALPLSVMIPLGFILFENQNGAEGPELNNPSDVTEGVGDEDAEEAHDTLDAILYAQKMGEDHAVLDSFEELSYIGDASLVWQYEDSGAVYVVKLTEAEFASVQRNMGKGGQVGESSPALSCRVWVLDGKGSVSTPYLKDGAGNEGCGIFDYEAEIIPDENFVNCISEILN